MNMILRTPLFLFLLTWIAGFSQSPLNVELVGNFTYDHQTNDIWGWVDDEGTEYALTGTVRGLSIISLEDPANPVEIDFIQGTTNTWRDIKTWEHYAYVSTEASDGILIADLSTIPNDTVAYHFIKPEFPGIENPLRKAHNIYIDERGLLYVSGSNLNNGGVMVLDLNEDPWNPEPLGAASDAYSHDVYARNGVMYSSEIYGGNLSLYQVDTPIVSMFLGQTKTPFEFTHNSWPSDNDSVVFTTDERSNAWVASYDISDYDNITELDRYKPAFTAGEGVIPHNVHVFNDFLVISYYTDGCIIVDAARPDNLIEVGNYDTYLEKHVGFSGVWGAYPFLPSGNVLVTDRGNGLFILEPNYVRGCYLEGSVKDSVTNEPIFQANIDIRSEEILLTTFTSPAGEYKTGKAVPGTFDVVYSAPGYYSKTLSLSFENGVLLEKEVLLQPKPRHSLSGTILSTLQNGPAPHAHVLITDGDFTYEATADINGDYVVPEVVEGTYNVYAGIWGEYFIGEIQVLASGAQAITLAPGYYDDFSFDFTWSVSGNSAQAMWQRAIPQYQSLFDAIDCGPGEDISDDFGDYAFVTGNTGTDAMKDDVDMGYTMLSSPSMDLSKYIDPLLSYRPWLCQFFDGIVNYTILASNGQDTVTLDTVTWDNIRGFWREAKEFRLKEHLALSGDMKVHFLASDTTGLEEENVVKAGLDVFSVTGELVSSISGLNNTIAGLKVNPNPFSDNLILVIEDLSALHSPRFELINVIGQVIASGKITSDRMQISLPQGLGGGLYLFRVSDGEGKTKTIKLLKQ